MPARHKPVQAGRLQAIYRPPGPVTAPPVTTAAGQPVIDSCVRPGCCTEVARGQQREEPDALVDECLAAALLVVDDAQRLADVRAQSS